MKIWSIIFFGLSGLLVACTSAHQIFPSPSQNSTKLPSTATTNHTPLPTTPPVTIPAEPTVIATNEPSLLSPALTPSPSEEINLPVLEPSLRIGKGVPTSLAISPDGKWMAVGTQFGVYQYYADTFEQAWFTSLADQADTMVFDPQSKRLGVSTGGSILLLDVTTGESITKLDGAGSSFAWSPDSLRLVSGSDCEQVMVWDAKSGVSLKELGTKKCSEGYSGMVVTWSADGWIYAASMGTKILAWNSDTYAPIDDFSAEGAPDTWVDALSAAPTGGLFAQYDRMGRPVVAIIDGEKNRQLRLLDRQVNGMIAALAWAPDGQRLALNYQEGSGLTIIWNALTGQVEQEINGFIAAAGLGFSPDGQTLFGLQSLNGQIHAVDVRTGGVLWDLSGHMRVASFLTWTQDGLVSTDGANLTWWNPGSGQPLRQETIGSPLAWVISWPPTCPDVYLYAGPQNSHYVGTAHSSHLLEGDESQYPFPTAWSWDGSRLADPSRVWDANSGEVMASLHDPAQQHMPDRVAWRPDGERLASADSLDMQPPVIWDSHSGEVLLTLNSNTKDLHPLWLGLAWSPDGKHLAAVGSLRYPNGGEYDEGMILIWNTGTGQQEQLLTSGMLDYRLWTVAWSPDGQYMAVGSTDCEIFLWDIAQGKPLARLAGHTDISDQLAWSPDGSRVASVARDGTLMIWDLASISP